jgi:aspartate-semialdehyde dehydrogenase
MRVAIIGATGVVGQTILQVLDERRVAVDALLAYASRDRETGIVFRDALVSIHAASIERVRADRPDVVFFASSDDASHAMAEALAADGAIVIDNSSTFRLDPRVPLIVPEVNSHVIRAHDRIFPVANCTAIVLCVALAPIERAIGLASVRVATYQAVSGAGRAGLETLANEEAAAFGRGPLAPGGAAAALTSSGGGAFAAPIFRNVVPQVGAYDGVGDTGEEQKVVAETRKMLERPDLHIAATTVRVPVRQAHSEAVFFQTKRATTQAELAVVFEGAPGVVFHSRGIVTPLEVEGTDLVHVARVRPEPDSDTDWQMWIVGDQLRKGAATNAVQILQTLIEQGRFAVVSGVPLR